MGRKWAMAVVSSLALVAGVCANAGPAPLPKDRKVAEPPVCFEGIDKHADYVFHLAYHVIYSDTTFVEVKDSNPIKLNFKWKDRSPNVSYMAILAVERNEFAKRKKADPSLKWLIADKLDGVLEAKLSPPESTVPLNTKEIPVTTYRVTLKDGKLSAEKVEAKKCSEEEPTRFLPPWTVGIVSSLSMIWLGLWFARRG